jgi:hypothetical protein
VSNINAFYQTTNLFGMSSDKDNIWLIYFIDNIAELLTPAK